MEVQLQAVGAPAWHSLTCDQVAAKCESDRNNGIASQEAEERLVRLGPNQIGEEEHWVRVRRLGRQFQDVLIWVLLVAALGSGFLLGAWIDAAAIGAIVLLNAALGYAQEARADSALAQLRELEAPDARVVRDGKPVDIPASTVVVGDLLVLEAGDLVPADARVTESWHLEVAEAALTGESLPVEKYSEPVRPDSGLGDQLSMVFAGTTVARGRGAALTVETGAGTQMGLIAASIRDPSPPSPLQIEMARIGRRLGLVALVSGALIFGAGVWQDYPFETMALTAVALAVAAIPEGLPAVIAATLAGGTRRMAEHRAIVRTLPAVEALGAVDVICTDKTGTLTRSELALATATVADGTVTSDDLLDPGEDLRRLLETAVLCNDTVQVGAELLGDPTETALLKAALEAGMDPKALREGRPRTDEAAFDSRRKRMSTIHLIDGATWEVHTKGAPEVVLERCSSVATGGGIVVLDDDRRAGLLSDANLLAAAGYRTLAFATRELDGQPGDLLDAENDLLYLGVVGLHDEIRPEVPEAIRTAAEAGVRTVMVTGDHVVTAEAVAGEVGITSGQVMSGAELHEIDGDRLTGDIADYRGFARVDPIDKVKIVEAWRGSGAIVAMTGDGVNDAPALNAADIGVAMGTGTDVSRESADMILTDDNYATIVIAIGEGRRIFRNLRNVVHYLLSSNASEVLYMLVGFIAFGFLGEPLLAVQLLWINLVSDALPALALGVDRPSIDLMTAKAPGRDILSRKNITILVGQGSILAAAALAALVLGHYVAGLPFAEVQTVVFTTMVFSQLLHSMSVRSGGERRLSMPDPPLLGAIAISVVLQMAVIYTAAGQSMFRTAPLSAVSLSVAVGLALLSMFFVRLDNRRRMA